MKTIILCKGLPEQLFKIYIPRKIVYVLTQVQENTKDLEDNQLLSNNSQGGHCFQIIWKL